MHLANTWIFENGLESLTRVAVDVHALAGPTLGEEGAGDVELALVEAITNVIRHGYGPNGGPIRVEVAAGSGGVVIRIFDWGQPIPGNALSQAGLARFDFNPENLSEIPEGGMGLSIITSTMDQVTYRSDEGQNTLTLIRYLRA